MGLIRYRVVPRLLAFRSFELLLVHVSHAAQMGSACDIRDCRSMHLELELELEKQRSPV